MQKERIDPKRERAYCPKCGKWEKIPSGAASIAAKTRVAEMVFRSGCQICRLKKTFGGKITGMLLPFLKKSMSPEEFSKILPGAMDNALEKSDENPWAPHFLKNC